MTDQELIEQGVNPTNGEFFYTKVAGTKKERFKLLNKIGKRYFNSEGFKKLDKFEKIYAHSLLEYYFVVLGKVPQAIMLTLLMPPTSTPFKNFDEIDTSKGGSINIRLPSKYANALLAE